jgi:hypothetical protein
MTMNMLQRSAAILAACALSTGALATAIQPARADYQSFTLAPGFTPDPQIGTGLSGGSYRTPDCGFTDLPSAPDHVLTVTRPFSFLRASVQAGGDVTLLIDGPDGRFCSDDVNGLMPEISGYWPAGTYYIWIGDFVGNPSGAYRYQLFLSEF